MSPLLNALSSIGRRLEGKVALITGGASGIGERTARLFTAHGAKVVIADIQDERGQLVCKDLGPESAFFVHCNVTDESEVQNAIDKAVSKYRKLDIMYNNAGTANAPKARIADNDKADFERVLSVNVVGVFLGTKHAARVMIPARSGSIISTASVCATVGGFATHAYTSSKHAVVGFTRSAAAELGQFGVRVNCVSPYGLLTSLATKFYEKTPVEDLEKSFSDRANLKGLKLTVDEIAQAVLFLASDDSRYVSGHNLLVDGGVAVVNNSFGMFNYSMT